MMNLETRTDIINKLVETRTDNCNKFYDVAYALAQTHRVDRAVIIGMYNDFCDEENEGLEED